MSSHSGEFLKPQSYLLLITANVILNLHLFKNNKIANVLGAKNDVLLCESFGSAS